MDAYDSDDWKDLDSDSDSEDKSTKTEFKPSYVLIAIDTEKSMFCPDNFNELPFWKCLDSCYEIANSLVLGDKNLVKGPMAIVFATNDRQKANLVEFKNPIPDTVKLLRDLKKKPIRDLKLEYQRKNDYDLADFFFFCRTKLMEINAEVYKRTLIYITNDDDPVLHDSRKRFKILNESDTYSKISLDLVVITFKDNFDSSVIYSEVLKCTKGSPVIQVDSSNVKDKLESFIQNKYVKYRLKFYPFKDDTDRYFDVTINKFNTSKRVFKNMYVTRDKEEEVKRSVPRKCVNNYKCIYSKNQPPLTVSAAEKESFMETPIPVGFTLLYVGKETNKFGWVIEAPSLMEKHYKETQPLFDIFWQFCMDKAKCLVCYRKFRMCSDVRLVELVPKFINYKRTFLVSVLPFGTEIYYPFVQPVESTPVNYSNNIAMSSLVDAFTFNYNPFNFKDPIEGKKKAYIKSQLLDEPLDELVDCTPTDEDIDKALAEPIKALASLDLLDMPPTANKRGRNVTGGSKFKKIKSE